LQLDTGNIPSTHQLGLIRTSDIQLTKKEFFNVIAGKYFLKAWWYWLLVLVVICTLTILEPSAVNLLVLSTVVVLIGYLVVYFWRFAYSKDNKIVLLKRYYEFDNEKMIGYVENESPTELKITHFIRIYKSSKYVLFYISKGQYIYLPKDSLERESDYFEIIGIVEQGIKRGSSL
jgi:hypothetical protein